jgi:hypothetical protein
LDGSEPPLDGLGDKVRSIFWGLALRSGPQNGIDPGQRALYETRPKRRRKAPLILSWGTPLRFVLSSGRTTPSGWVDQMTACIGRREFITLLGGAAAAWPLAARAQQRAFPVIGLLSSRSPAVDMLLIAVIRQALNETGLVEGQNVTVDYRWAEGQYDRVAGLAADLARQQVAVIVTLVARVTRTEGTVSSA